MKIRVPGLAQEVKDTRYLGKCARCNAIIEVPFSDLHTHGLIAPETAHMVACPACGTTVKVIILYREGSDTFNLLQKEIDEYEKPVARNLGTDN